jgi:hypothetical protein
VIRSGGRLYFYIQGEHIMTKLQELYWSAQTLHDKIFSLERYIYKITAQGKTPRKTYERYFSLLDELRMLNAEMLMIEAA